MVDLSVSIEGFMMMVVLLAGYVLVGNYLLIKPIRLLIKSRKAEQESVEEKGTGFLKKIDSLERSYKEKLQNLRSELEEKEKNSREATKKDIDAMLHEAHVSANNTIRQYQEELLQEKENILSDYRKNIGTISDMVAGKILR